MTKDTAWAIFYANLVAMAMHPGNKHPTTLTDLALKADKLLEEYNKRFPEA